MKGLLVLPFYACSFGLLHAQEAPKLSAPVFSGFIQFQYFDTDRIGATRKNLFEIRRARFGVSQKIDDMITARMSIDFAEGANRDETRIKDAVIDFDLSKSFHRPTKASFGQMSVPLGYEIERSEVQREFPERTAYNRALFPGERSRGIIFRTNTSKLVQVGLGILNSLTVNDAEQLGTGLASSNRLGALGFIRWTEKDANFGLSGFAGGRPSYTVGANTSPGGDRHFVYADGTYTFSKKLFVKGEVMVGRDRVGNPAALPTRTAHPLSGFQTHVGYSIDGRNQLNFRWEQFDPNLDAGGNAVNGYGLAAVHVIDGNAKIVLGHEIFTDEARANGKRYDQTTLRLQVRF